MKNIKGVKDCFGCGVCAAVCAKNAIKIEFNKEGFYVPALNMEACSNCGLCTEVCAFLYNDLAIKNHSKHCYGAWSNNVMTRKRCSSGGIGYELGKFLQNKGYKVCGVKYNVQTQRAEHFIAENEKDLMQTIGSKYIQSYTVDGFKAINRKGRYLVTGTPCQIDSFRRYIQKFKVEANFVLMDFFCHSVPSMLAWKKYLQNVEKKIGRTTYASWRNKFTGWHDSYAIAIDGNSKDDNCDSKDDNVNYNIYVPEKGHSYNSRLSEGDLFYKLFLGDYCCNPACQKNCKYKYDKSSADIRIGDFWGSTFEKDEDGVSAVVAFTEKGNDILRSLDCTLIDYPFEIVAEGQMKRNAGKHFLSNVVYKWLVSSSINQGFIRIVFGVDWIWRLPKRMINKLKRLFS